MKSKSIQDLNQKLGSEPIFTIVCNERDVTVERAVRPLIYTPQNLDRFWRAASAFPYLFNKSTMNGPNDLLNQFFIEDDNGKITTDSIMWVVDDFVGIFYLTDLKYPSEASVHYSFFDRRFNGRLPLVQRMLRYVFEKYQFNRLNAEIPTYAKNTTHYFAQECGFKFEGRKRASNFYKDQWFDACMYGILKSEVLDGSEA